MRSIYPHARGRRCQQCASEIAGEIVLPDHHGDGLDLAFRGHFLERLRCSCWQRLFRHHRCGFGAEILGHQAARNNGAAYESWAPRFPHRGRPVRRS
jgi:hypothetical protein